jgi:hypothetical protein
MVVFAQIWQNLVKWARWFLVFLYGGFACKYHYLLAEKNMEIMRRMGLENSGSFHRLWITTGIKDS